MEDPASTRTARTDKSQYFVNWVFVKRSFRKPRPALSTRNPPPEYDLSEDSSLLKELLRPENTSPYFGNGRSRLRRLEVRAWDGGLPLSHKALSTRALT